MSDEEDDEKGKHKQSTQAIAQEPQEEFISPENIPTKTEGSPGTPAQDREPPRH